MQDKQFPQAKAATAQDDQLGQIMGAGQAELGTDVASVLKNTYMLLGMTTALSALVAFLTINVPFSPLMHFGALIGALVISFVMTKAANSVWGIVLAFAFTGLLGLTIGPIVGHYIGIGGAGNVVNAFGLTAFAFFGLSGYALVTRKDFSFLSGFITIGFFVILGAFLINIFVGSSVIALTICSVIVLFASAAILYETSAIVHGGQTNYILATVSLYSSIYNLFMSLLHLLMAFGGEE